MFQFEEQKKQGGAKPDGFRAAANEFGVATWFICTEF
jgi:hypothetical protein